MDFRILGPLEVLDGDRTVELGGAKQRALLAILLLHANELVSTDRLIDALWGERPPPAALTTVRAYISRLRRAFDANGDSPAASGPDGLLVTRARGYLIHVASGELDADRFSGLLEQGREALAAGDPAGAAILLRSGLALWRGLPLADFAYETFAQSAIAQLADLRLAALEERVEADLACGLDRQLVGELTALVQESPLRERVRSQLMLALYRAGRQAEALQTYQDFRHMLSEQLGLDPSPGIQQLELAILNRDPLLRASTMGIAAAAPGLSEATVGRGAPNWLRRLVLGGTLVIAGALGATFFALSDERTAPPARIAADSVGTISPTSGAIAGQIPVGVPLSRLTEGGGALWATSYDTGTITRINPQTHAVVQTISVGSTPSGIAFGAGAVWVASNFGNTVRRIDPRLNLVVDTIPVGNAPSGVAVSDGSVWVTNVSDGTLSRIDATSGKPIAKVAVGGSPTDVAVGLGSVWVSDEAGARVLRIDPHTDHVTGQINVGNGPGAIATYAGSVWVANSLDGTVSRIDPHTNSSVGEVRVGEGPVALAAGAGDLWVANEFGRSVSRIDPNTNPVARMISVGNRPEGLAFVSGTLWVSAQASDTIHRGGTLTVLSSASFNSIDPAYQTATAAPTATTYMTRDGLTAFKRVGGADGRDVEPDLATSLPTPTDGGRTYTFQVRRGIRYSNGAPLRPEDFRRALERNFGPAYYWGNIVGGAACAAQPSRCDLSAGIITDDAANTVTFHLVAPDPEFLQRLAFWPAVAVPAGTPNADVGTHPLPTTGPYQIANYSPSREVRLVRNPYFHEWSRAARPDGYPDQIVWRIGASPSAEVSAVEQGRADFTVDGVPPDRLREVQTRFAGQLHVNPNDVTPLLFLNTRVAPFHDIKVRQALNYAIDRRETATLIGQAAAPTCQLLPPYISGYTPYCPYTRNPSTTGTWQGPDLARARTLLAASHTRGMKITIWSQPGFPTDFTQVGRYLVSVLDQLGYRARIKAFAPNDATFSNGFVDSRMHVQAAFYTAASAYPSASEFVAFFFSCQTFVPGNPTMSTNPSEFCNPRLDSTIHAALAAENANSAAAAQLWSTADRQLTDQAPFVSLGTPSLLDFVSQRAGNYLYNPVQYLIDQMWIR